MTDSGSTPNGPGPTAGATAAAQRHTVFQTSLMSALLDGVYDGEMTIGELLEHGDFGVGTFNALDGEMVVLDSVCYQLRGSGEATVAGTGPADTVRRAHPLCTDHLEGVAAQSLPSRSGEPCRRAHPLRELPVCDAHRRRFPVGPHPHRGPAAQAIPAVAGGHQERTGHPVRRRQRDRRRISAPRCTSRGSGCRVVTCTSSTTTANVAATSWTTRSRRGTLELCLGTDLHVALPLTSSFRRAQLNPDDLAEQVAQTENHR